MEFSLKEVDPILKSFLIVISLNKESTSKISFDFTLIEKSNNEIIDIIDKKYRGTGCTLSSAITAALAAAETAARANAPVGPAGFGMKDPAALLTLISTTIGIDEATVKTRIAAGETLAAIAGSKKDALITALVADETKRIDAAVTAGKLTAAQATTLKANLTAHVTDEVNSTRPMGPKGGDKGGRGGKGGRGHGGPMGGAPATAGALSLPATPTA